MLVFPLFFFFLFFTCFLKPLALLAATPDLQAHLQGAGCFHTVLKSGSCIPVSWFRFMYGQRKIKINRSLGVKRPVAAREVTEGGV